MRIRAFSLAAAVALRCARGAEAGAGAGAGAAQACQSWDVDAREAVAQTAPYFASFNIDGSRDRGFFDLDWAAPALAAAARGLAPPAGAGGGGGGGLVRFGGTGNNYLYYGVGAAPACPPTRPHAVECLNATLWAGLAAAAAAARAPLVVGVNMFPNATVPADRAFAPANAEALFTWVRARGDDIFGVELGNELNGGLVTAAQQAAGLRALDAALARVYGAAPRPRLIGPDALGVHTPAGGGPWLPTATILQYLADFCRDMGGALFAVTHHEYIEVNETAVLDPAFLDQTGELAALVVRAIRNVSASVEIWAGEVGPHNGGTTPNPDCSGNKVCGRFGSALWYADAMSAKARAGYAAFCRQDFVGADYGLVNYTTLAPTPDYWLLALWKRLVGVRVLAVSPPADTRVRAYAFCGTTASTVTLVFINLASTPACLTPPGIANPVKPRTEWNLTPDDGVSVTAAGVRLNGVLLALGAGGALPPLTGQSVPATVDIQLPPVSVTLISFPTIADACGGR